MLDIFVLYPHPSGLNPDLNQTALFSWNQYLILILGDFSFNKATSNIAAVKRKIWWAQEDSNLRPHAYQACALTTWAMSPFLTRLAFLLRRAIPRDKGFFKPLTHAGGDNRDRTDDPLLAKQVLSQLSYTPVVIALGFLFCCPTGPQKLNNDS